MNKFGINAEVNIKIGDNKDVVFLILSFIFSCSFLYFFAGKSYEEFKTLDSQIAESEVSLSSKQELLTNIQDFNNENSNASIDAEKLESFISNRNNYEDFWAHINILANKNALELSSLDLSSSSSSSSTSSSISSEGDADMATSTVSQEVQEGGINFSVSGDFSNFMNFIKTLENGIPFVQENSLSISYGSSDSESVSETVGEEEVDPYPSLTYNVSFKFVYY